MALGEKGILALMDDELPSLRVKQSLFSRYCQKRNNRQEGNPKEEVAGKAGIGKLNKMPRILLVVAAGLFFSVYFSKNSSPVISAEADLGVTTAHEPIILKFDPMEKVRISVEQVKLAEQKEQEKMVERSKELEKITEDKKEKEESENSQEQKYQNLVSGSPLEKMLPFIAKYDNETASFLIAIAKKESDWGTYSPKKAGSDCFNYWGYRGGYNQTDSGYSCFDSAEQAISVVGARIHELLDKKINTPEKMVVWKCGASCAGHDPAGVRKWITDVALYYDKLNS